MGFLDRILKREAEKLVNSVIDGFAEKASGANTANQPTAAASGVLSKEEESCYKSAAVVAQRIEKVLADHYQGYTFRRDVPIADFGQKQYKTCSKYTIDYVISDPSGRETAAVMILNCGMESKNWTASLYRILEDRGIRHAHFLLHLPNRTSYVEEQLKKIL